MLFKPLKAPAFMAPTAAVRALESERPDKHADTAPGPRQADNWDMLGQRRKKTHHVISQGLSKEREGQTCKRDISHTRPSSPWDVGLT